MWLLVVVCSRVLYLEPALQRLGAGVLERYPNRRFPPVVGIHCAERILQPLLRLRGFPAKQKVPNSPGAVVRNSGRESEKDIFFLQIIFLRAIYFFGFSGGGKVF